MGGALPETSASVEVNAGFTYGHISPPESRQVNAPTAQKRVPPETIPHPNDIEINNEIDIKHQAQNSEAHALATTAVPNIKTACLVDIWPALETRQRQFFVATGCCSCCKLTAERQFFELRAASGRCTSSWPGCCFADDSNELGHPAPCMPKFTSHHDEERPRLRCCGVTHNLSPHLRNDAAEKYVYLLLRARNRRIRSPRHTTQQQ